MKRRYTSDEQILEAAAQILQERTIRYGEVLDAPQKSARLACAKLGAREHEVFAVMWLDSQLRLLRFEEIFRGTLTQTAVYPREIVKRALDVNAGAALLVHNHPSGRCDPSHADKVLTDGLKKTLALVDVRVIDHLIVSGDQWSSMANMGVM